MGVETGMERAWAMAPSRRGVVAGMSAALAAPQMLLAAPDPVAPRLFAGTALNRNRLALHFERVDLPLPEILLSNGTGMVRLDRLPHRTRIVTLWAEWCVPCLVEARDFAELQRRFGGSGFEILALLTASMQRLAFAGARARLEQARVGPLPLLVEPDGGKRLMLELSPSPFGNGGSMPCTLLVDARGRIRGRSKGAPTVTRMAPGSTGIRSGVPLTDADKQAMLAGNGGTLWRSPEAEVLVAALRDGILDTL